MNDLPAIEVSETVQDTFCYFAEDFLAGATAEFLDFAIDGVETSAFAELHGYRDGGGLFVHESAVILADVGRCAIFVELELA